MTQQRLTLGLFMAHDHRARQNEVRTTYLRAPTIPHLWRVCCESALLLACELGGELQPGRPSSARARMRARMLPPLRSTAVRGRVVVTVVKRLKRVTRSHVIYYHHTQVCVAHFIICSCACVCIHIFRGLCQQTTMITRESNQILCCVISRHTRTSCSSRRAQPTWQRPRPVSTRV